MPDLHPVAWVLLVAAEIAVLMRAVLRPHREPASRLAWIIVILVVPIIGMIAYLLIGEARLSPGRKARARAIEATLPRPEGDDAAARTLADSRHGAPFALARTVNRLSPTGGNSATVAHDSNAAIDSMVEDVDSAERSVHACFYIWLADGNGLKIKDAFIRAARRGVAVRGLADALGSRRLINSPHWQEMIDSGCEMRVAFPVGNPLWTLIRGRVDLRNHRKLLVIDNRIAWCGSQNAADPEFRIKPRYAPWVDIMTRWEGPAARQCQYLFVSDWMGEHGEDLSGLLTEPASPGSGDVIAQVLGTGPTLSFDAMPACFSEMIHSAREELIVTTPYFVPDEQLLFALTSAARRGVHTIMIFPKRNDSRIVAGISRSYYHDLISAGVEIYEFRPGLLHAKTMVVDGVVGIIGSANLDRRSFELNFENNIMFADRAFAAAVRTRQNEFLAQSDRVSEAEVASWSIATRLWQNLLDTLSPII
jgi:cardiolipin synthase